MPDYQRKVHWGGVPPSRGCGASPAKQTTNPAAVTCQTCIVMHRLPGWEEAMRRRKKARLEQLKRELEEDA